jgi:hypothetical protein
MTGIVKKDKLIGFTMIVGEYLLNCVSYYPYNINEQKKLTSLQYQRTKKIQLSERPKYTK